MVKSKSGSMTIDEIKELIKSKFLMASGILYCLSRRECDQIADSLQAVNDLLLGFCVINLGELELVEDSHSWFAQGYVFYFIFTNKCNT